MGWGTDYFKRSWIGMEDQILQGTMGWDGGPNIARDHEMGWGPNIARDLGMRWGTKYCKGSCNGIGD